MTIPARTRAYAALMGRIMRPIEELSPEQIPEARERRVRFQASQVGQQVSGRAHPGTDITERLERIGDVDLRLRVYVPRVRTSDPLPVVVNFHGGGWTMGVAEQTEWLSSNVAAQADVVVVSVDYRLAPENPFPAAIDDAVGATTWVAEHAEELGADGERLAVMGDSAGANLAAVVALECRTQVRHQVLIYPIADMAEIFESERRMPDALILSSAGLQTFQSHYLSGHDPKDGRASPLRRDDLAGAPPALIQTAEHDTLLDDGAHYAEALRAAGVPVRYTCYRDAVHGYIAIPGVCPPAAQALDEIVSELRAALH